MLEQLIMEGIYLGRILLAGVCGGIIGYERQNRRKTAGLRTHVIVAVSSALMVLLSKYGFQDVVGEYVRVDPSRVASGAVTAIGFLGSGIIFFRNNNVSGVTTSAGIWATVGVGMAIGSGMYMAGISCTLIVLLVELFLGRGGAFARKGKETREVSVEYGIDDMEKNIMKSISEQINTEGGKIVRTVIKRKEQGLLRGYIWAEMSPEWDEADFVEKAAAREGVMKVTVQ